MSKIVNTNTRKLPTILGGGILDVAFVGLCFAKVGLSLTLAAELMAAGGGMVVAGRYA